MEPSPSNPRINRQVLVTGPLGTLSMPLHPFVQIHQPGPDEPMPNRRPLDVEEEEEDGEVEAAQPIVLVKVADPESRDQKTMWGTTRALIRNMVEGVSEGFTVPVQLVGVGYRAALEPPPKALPGQPDGRPKVSLKLGYSHPVELEVPAGVEVRVPVPQRLVIQGADLGLITQFAAKIRAWRPPEPYNQKGVFVSNETIKKK
ncbi:hypothetical protein HDU67_004069, partial [Dinochytrium kinnereticum]